MFWNSQNVKFARLTPRRYTVTIDSDNTSDKSKTDPSSSEHINEIWVVPYRGFGYFWLPKLHKRPYKARIIANSSSCTTTELSVLLLSNLML